MQINIFFCYAQEDEALLNELKAHLQSLRHEQRIEMRCDRDVHAGAEWKRALSEHLNSSHIILLLMSADFIASDHFNSVEIRQVLKRHECGKAHVIPIILRPVHWQGTPFGHFLALPSDGRPVTKWPNRDSAFYNIVQEIKKVIDELQEPVGVEVGNFQENSRDINLSASPSSNRIVPLGIEILPKPSAALRTDRSILVVALGSIVALLLVATSAFYAVHMWLLIIEVISIILVGLAGIGIAASRKKKQAKPHFFTGTELSRLEYISATKLERHIDQIHYDGGNIPAVETRYRKLDLVLGDLQKKGQIGDISSTKQYVSGLCELKWGNIDFGDPNVPAACIFFSTETSPILLMVGSIDHLLTGERQKKYTFSKEQAGADGSSLPRILQMIKFGIEHHQEWSRGLVGDAYDYLFVAGFVQDKLINRLRVQNIATDFPKKCFHFVAYVHTRVLPPSEQQVLTLFSNNTIRERDKHDIKRILSNARPIYICSPLYVAHQGDEGNSARIEEPVRKEG